MATWCPDLSGDLAAILVDNAHTLFMNRGTQTYNTAINALNDLSDIPLSPYDYTVSFDFDQSLAPFIRPRRPTLDTTDFTLQQPPDPGAAPGFVGNPLTFTTAPDLDLPEPVLTYGPRPNTPNIALPIAPPPPDYIEMPIEPDYELPPVPTFESLNLPTVPTLELPEFEGERPVWVEPPFAETWAFDPQAYESVMLDRLVAALDPMLQSNPALPEHIESAIFQKGRSRAEVETQREVDQAYAEFANRGFSEPAGMLSARLLEIRQGGQNRIAEFNRDAVIKQYEETLANLRFAIVQGAALEGVFIQLHIEDNRNALQAATFLRESAIAVLNVRLSVFNARQQAYATDAQVLEARIRASMATIELYRAQIEGELAKGQVNEQRVRLYEGLLRGLGVMADFYRERVNAVKVQTEVDRNVVERFKAQVDAYDSRWRAHVAEMQAWGAGIEAEGKRADVFRTLMDGRMKKVDAWATTNNQQIEQERLRIQQHGQQLQAFDSRIRRFSAFLDAERARLAAVASREDAKTRLYVADASVEQAASAATDRSYQLGLERAKAELEGRLAYGQQMIAQFKGLIDQSIAIAEAKARVASQLAASTMSAVGYSASVGSSKSRSNSCSANFSFAGEIADAGI
ncbi:hypothetical protein [Luteimonas saliphila]|uniref:hypothetical protein n=1 Tax=Luteimonas saliphila TaxID=2804919 RepID=UPI00192E2DEE|nr:hypothetical protein [Luteimonas saliphila]